MKPQTKLFGIHNVQSAFETKAVRPTGAETNAGGLGGGERQRPISTALENKLYFTRKHCTHFTHTKSTQHV